jgi:hypothetical protein
MNQNPAVRLHDDTYLMLKELADEQGRKLNKVLEMLVLTEYLRTHSNGKPPPEPPVPPVPPNPDYARLIAIEARLDKLEKWKNTGL